VEQFKNPPIQEALLDIQVTLPSDVNLETLKGFHNGIEARFREKQERISWQPGFQIFVLAAQWEQDTMFEPSPWRIGRSPDLSANYRPRLARSSADPLPAGP